MTKTNIKPKRIRSTTFMVVQQTKPEYFNGTWGDTTTIDSYANDFINRWSKNHTQKLKHIAIILHDKDKYLNHKPKEEHFHFYIEFQTKVDLKFVAKEAGVEEQQVESMKRGRYARDNMLAYMIHAKQAEKHQYQPTEVYCEDSEILDDLHNVYGWKNGWYQQYYDEHIEDWSNQLHSVKAKKNSLSLEKVLDDILYGRITKQNVLLTNELYELYGRNKNKMDQAFQAYAERKSELIGNSVDYDGDLSVYPVFIHGQSGLGKTKFINDIKKRLPKDYTVYMGDGKHPMDNYSGEDVLVLDDVDVNAISVKGWLQLLDNHNIHNADARYKDKPVSSTLILMTTTKNIDEFFKDYFAKDNEPLEQVKRRIQMIIELVPNNPDSTWSMEDFPVLARVYTHYDIHDGYTHCNEKNNKYDQYQFYFKGEMPLDTAVKMINNVANKNVVKLVELLKSNEETND